MQRNRSCPVAVGGDYCVTSRTANRPALANSPSPIAPLSARRNVTQYNNPCSLSTCVDGTFPTQLGLLGQVAALSFYMNELSGTMPSQLGVMSLVSKMCAVPSATLRPHAPRVYLSLTPATNALGYSSATACPEAFPTRSLAAHRPLRLRL